MGTTPDQSGLSFGGGRFSCRSPRPHHGRTRSRSDTPRHEPNGGEWSGGSGQWVGDLRDRSCLLRCSLLLNARAQKEHLYFFSAVDGLRAGEVGEVSLGEVALPGAGITTGTGGSGATLDRDGRPEDSGRRRWTGWRAGNQTSSSLSRSCGAMSEGTGGGGRGGRRSGQRGLGDPDSACAGSGFAWTGPSVGVNRGRRGSVSRWTE